MHQVYDRKRELDQQQQLLSVLSLSSSLQSQPNKHHVNTNNHNHTDNMSSSQLKFVGLNRRFRVYKYTPNQYDHFKPHIDAGFPPSGIIIPSNSFHISHQKEDKYNENSANATSSTTNTFPVLQFDDTAQFIQTLQNQPPFQDQYDIIDVVSRLTILFYLNDNFTGGTTNFYEPIIVPPEQPPQNENKFEVQEDTADHFDDTTNRMIASIQPQTGMVLIFPQCVGVDVMDQYAKYHWPMHEGSPVHLGSPVSKYVIRSDLLFAEVIPQTPKYKLKSRD
jgi:hypothetical protein